MLVHGRWFSLGTPASFTTKTGHRDIAEILLKVALNTINQSIQQCCMVLYCITMTKCSTADRTYCDTVCHWFPVHSHPPGTTVYPPPQQNWLPQYNWNIHWGKADDHNCNYRHPKMADVESGKNLFCRLNCFYNVF